MRYIASQLGTITYRFPKTSDGIYMRDYPTIEKENLECGPLYSEIKDLKSHWYLHSPLRVILSLALLAFTTALTVHCLSLREMLPQGEIWQTILEKTSYLTPMLYWPMWVMLLCTVGLIVACEMAIPSKTNGNMKESSTPMGLVGFSAIVFDLIWFLPHRQDALGTFSLVGLGLWILTCLCTVMEQLLYYIGPKDKHRVRISRKQYKRQYKQLSKRKANCIKGAEKTEKQLRRDCYIEEEEALCLAAVEYYYRKQAL